MAVGWVNQTGLGRRILEDNRMKTTVMDMTGHTCCDRPMERHLFDGDEYLCRICRRPRALHQSYPFSPGYPQSFISTDARARYRGPHPQFKVRFSRADEPGPISDSLRRHVDQQRAYEAAYLARVINNLQQSDKPGLR